MKISPLSTVAEVAQGHPEALPVLARHGIDAAARGPLPIAVVAVKGRLDLRSLMRELAEAVEGAR